jgi:transposase
MEVLFDICCGLDVHSLFVVACVMRGVLSGKPEKLIRTFQTTTRGLCELRDWLVGLGCREVAMESTGVYWRPVWHVLEGPEFHLWLANARNIKHAKGRKTDVGDAEWIAKLLRSGMIVPSFVPPEPIRDLRDMTRLRVSFVHEATAERNRIQKVLEDTNIKVAEYVSDLFGVSGREMLAELIKAERKPDAARIADLARGRMRKRIPELIEALDGELREHHRKLLRMAMRHLQQVEELIAEVEQEITALLEPYRAQEALLTTIPGVSHTTAAVIIAEFGVDMSVFPTPDHMASWAGLSPGKNESASKKRPAKTRPGNRHARSGLCEVVWAISHTRNTYLGATFWRLAGRIGKQKAVLAIARKTAVAIHCMLSANVTYTELGADYRRRVDAERYERKLLERVRALGYEVVRRPEQIEGQVS